MKLLRKHRTTQVPSPELNETDRLRILINAIADAIIYTDKNGRILLYNSAALNLIDTNTSLAHQRIDDALPLTTENGKKVLPSTLASDTQITRSDLLYSYDAEGVDRINIDLLVTPMRANFGARGDGTIYIVRDITKAKSLDEERDEFISVVSHELRTPVAVTEGTVSNAQLMLERGYSPERLKEALEAAHAQILYLSSMVNDLSTLSRAERGINDTPEDIVVEDLLSELYTEYAPQATAKGLTFNIDAGPKLGVLFVSKLYIAEMLQNFITNAIKYSLTGTITLHVVRDGEAVTFSVKDTGIGISTSDQKKIFQKFYRSEDYRTRETSGTGLGLYVTKKLADKLNTTITVKSRLNHGSTFSFTIKSSRGRLPLTRVKH